MNEAFRTTSYACGLDLGQASAYTAFAVVEKTVVEPADPDVADEVGYSVRHLERFPVGTPYAEIFAQVRGRLLQGRLTEAPRVVDRTGVGDAVVAMLKRGCPEARIVEVTITSGLAAAKGPRGGWLVPKRELVGILVLLQTRKLKIPSGLAEADTLVRELQTFSAGVVPPSAGEGIDWREGVHDDLVLAVGIAVWKAGRSRSLRNWNRWMDAMQKPTPFAERMFQ